MKILFIGDIVGKAAREKTKEHISILKKKYGSIKKQTVKFIGTESIKFNETNYILHHYKLMSQNSNLPEDKRLDFDIWLNPKNNLIYKITYEKAGKWEYRLKNFEINELKILINKLAIKLFEKINAKTTIKYIIVTILFLFLLNLTNGLSSRSDISLMPTTG